MKTSMMVVTALMLFVTIAAASAFDAQAQAKVSSCDPTVSLKVSAAGLSPGERCVIAFGSARFSAFNANALGVYTSIHENVLPAGFYDRVVFRCKNAARIVPVKFAVSLRPCGFKMGDNRPMIRTAVVEEPPVIPPEVPDCGSKCLPAEQDHHGDEGDY
ncbi:MAG: hypothetical protein V1735_06290 [Nanoarchaeota archaeon]